VLVPNDELFAIETLEGYLLTPYDPEIEEQLKIGRELMTWRQQWKA
jgi:hypothetical protein